MLILSYIFLGLLFFDCLVVCCLFFRKERPFEKYEEQLDYYLETVESTKYGKAAYNNIRYSFMFTNKG